MKLTRDAAIGVARQAAAEEAARQHLDDWDTESLLAEGESVVAEIFEALADTSRVSNGEEVKEWHHRALREADLDWGGLGINRTRLTGAVEAYLSRPWLTHPTLDWLAVDLLLYAEWIASYIALRTQALGLMRTALRMSKGPIAAASSYVWMLLKWGLWLAVGVGLYTWAPWAAMTWLLLTFLRRHAKRRALRPLANTLAEMLRCYAVVATEVFSWEVVWEELRRTRKHGAVWDSVLYRLVESRRVFSSSTAPAATGGTGSLIQR